MGALDKRVERTRTRRERIAVRHVHAKLTCGVHGVVIQRTRLGARGERGEIFAAVVDRASHKIVYTVCRTTLDESTLSMRPREEGNW